MGFKFPKLRESSRGIDDTKVGTKVVSEIDRELALSAICFISLISMSY